MSEELDYGFEIYSLDELERNDEDVGDVGTLGVGTHFFDDRESIRNLYRSVIMQGMRDLGLSNIHEQNAVLRWLQRDTFSTCCEIADWNESWIRELFESIDSLSDPVRKPITRQCLFMMKAISKLEHNTMPFDSTPAIAYPDDLRDYSQPVHSELRRMNSEKKPKKKRRRRRVARRADEGAPT